MTADATLRTEEVLLAASATDAADLHERAVEHPDMTPELAAVLSTSQVELEYEIQSGVAIRD